MKTLEHVYQEAQQAVQFIPEGPYRVVAFQLELARLRNQTDAIIPYGSPEHASSNSDTQSEGIRSETRIRILEMRRDGYFDQPRLPGEVRAELQTRGYHHNPADVRMALLRMAQSKQLKRLRGGNREFRYVKP